jgi:flagellar motor protein MotB
MIPVHAFSRVFHTYCHERKNVLCTEGQGERRGDMKKIVVWVGIVTLSMMVVSCASTGKYKKLEGEYNDLQTRYNSLQAGYSACREQVGQVEQEKADLLAREEKAKATYEQLMSELQKEVSEGQIAIQQFEDKLTLNVAEKIFFDSGSAELKPRGKAVLVKVGHIVKGLTDKVIRVEGHTDNVPISKSLQATYRTNWELSAARATTVVRFLQEHAGVPPQMLMAAAFGEYRPIAPNDTPANRQKNRRIEIALQNRDVMKRMEAPITPEKKEVPTQTETTPTPGTKEAPPQTETPPAPVPQEKPEQ